MHENSDSLDLDLLIVDDSYQDMIDKMTIDYHLHLASEQANGLANAEQLFVPRILEKIQGHIAVLQEGLIKEDRTLLSKPCDEGGSPDQKQRLQMLLSVVDKYRT